MQLPASEIGLTDRSSPISSSPVSPLAEGYDLLGAGEPLLALRCFDQAAALSPDTETHAARAEALLALSRLEEAIAAWASAVEGTPGSLTYRLGLGEAQLMAGSFEAAAETLEEAVRIRSDSPRAQQLLARVLTKRGDFSGAIRRYREAIHLDGESRETLCELGLLLIDHAREGEGIALLERCARRHPDDSAVHYHLGRAWHALLEADRARDFLARYLELDPADPLDARALLDRIDREEVSRQSGATTLPRGYVRALFDQYADRFDRDVRAQLGYHAPELLQSLIEPLLGEREIAPCSLQVLDLGCGTGLSGVPLRAWARYLCGIDLSPAMIEQATQRGIYDLLRVDDLASVLSEERARWDLIVACDALVYLGDLREVFAFGFEALRAGGWFVATVEAPDSEQEIEFKPTRRFGHSESYLRRLASERGFVVGKLTTSQVRRERGKPVNGFAFVLERPASSAHLESTPERAS